MSIVSLRHFQTEGHDWLGELGYCATIICYLALQNYNISGFMFYNYNAHLIILLVMFFAQRIWFILWRTAQFSDGPGLRFAVHIVLFFIFLDSFYCVMHLAKKESFTASLYLATPLTASVLFYNVYLKVHTNVFTAELFNMLSRCVYHSLEMWYCIGVLPLRFLQTEFLYCDTSRCMLLSCFITMHSFIMMFCLELHCLGSEVLQQTRMLGEWRSIADPSTLQPPSAKPLEWSYHNCPYPRGAAVQCKGRYYEAVATLNTSDPSCSPYLLNAIVFGLADYERTRTLVLAATLVLNLCLLPCIMWSNHWSMYGVMLFPICVHFLHVKYRHHHAFFNPARLNLAQLQWDLNAEMTQCRLNSGLPPLNGRQHADPWSDNADDAMDNHHDGNYDEDRPDGPPSSTNPLMDVLGDHGGAGQLQYPLFMSAVSASTMFFFGAAGAPRYDAGIRGDM